MPLAELKLASKAYSAFQLHRVARVAKRFSKRTEKALDAAGLSQYSKVVATAVGGIVGFAVMKAPFLAAILPNERIDELVIVLVTTLTVYLFPANKAKEQKSEK